MYEDEDLQEIHEDIIELNEDISTLRRDLDNISASIEGSGENVTLNGTAEARFKKPPLPMGNSEQESTEGTNLIGLDTNQYKVDLSAGDKLTITNNTSEEIKIYLYSNYGDSEKNDWFSFAANSTRTITLLYDAKAIAWLNAINGIAWCNSGETALPYEKYTGGQASPNPDYPQEITNVTGDVEVKVQNKNLLSNNKEDWEQGSVNPLNGELTTSTTRIRNKNKKQIKANTNYVIKVNNNNYKLINFEIYDKINNFITSGTNLFNISNFDNMTEIAFTSPTDAYYIIYVIRNLENTTITNTEIENINVQFEEGTTATNYVEHKEQTFIFPLGNEKLMLGDYLADDGIHHVRGQVVFDGSEDENWEIWQITSTNVQRFYIKDIIIPKTSSTSLCSHFKFKNDNSDVQHFRYGGVAFKEFIIYIDRAIETVEQLKVWLQSNPITVEYPLNEEVIVPYTSAQQEVYNQIKQAISYEEQTNVSGFSTKVSPKFEVKAFRNMNTSIESLQARIELLKGRS